MPKQLNFHDPGCLNAKDFYELYSMPLARVFYNISQRGISVDPNKLQQLRLKVDQELRRECINISAILKGQSVVPQSPTKEAIKAGTAVALNPTTLNLSSNDQIIATLKSLGVPPPIKRGRGTETVDAEALEELFAESGHPFLKHLLRCRELNKLKGTYIDAELENNTLYSTYFVTGTVTGRRSARQTFLGLGNNAQNQPVHGDLAQEYLSCLIARPGKIFLVCDQKQAEDWLVSGLIADIGGDYSGLNELLADIDRHKKLASFLFSKPEDQCGKGTPERFMGKKVRHAGNYDMGANRFAGEMAKEGFTTTSQFCQWLLNKFHDGNPGIRGVYHKYVQLQLTTTRQLVTPFGRTRQFLGLRDFSDNHKLFKEGYAQIPQSSVGDNTGFSVLWIEQNFPGLVISDGHDAVKLEVDDNINSVIAASQLLRQSFDRIIRLPNGLEITIPIELEMGYSLGTLKTCANLTTDGLKIIYSGLQRQAKVPLITTCGQQQQPSAQL